jgi:hypothetical protein
VCCNVSFLFYSITCHDHINIILRYNEYISWTSYRPAVSFFFFWRPEMIFGYYKSGTRQFLEFRDVIGLPCNSEVDSPNTSFNPEGCWASLSLRQLWGEGARWLLKERRWVRLGRAAQCSANQNLTEDSVHQALSMGGVRGKHLQQNICLARPPFVAVII